MRAFAAARGPYQEGAHNFVYPSTYIFIHLKKLHGPTQHISYGLRRPLDSSRSSQPIAIVTSSIEPASNLRVHIANLEPIYIRLRAHAANLGPIYIRFRAHAANFAKGPTERAFPA
jgi:hypothetical protein